MADWCVSFATWFFVITYHYSAGGKTDCLVGNTIYAKMNQCFRLAASST